MSGDGPHIAVLRRAVMEILGISNCTSTSATTGISPAAMKMGV